MGRPADARDVATQALVEARRRSAAADQPASLPAVREVSIALDRLGQVARSQGDWSQAEAAYRESLEIRRRLVERLGGTPEALRDVSISLTNVGQVARSQGNWSQAEAAYRESLEIGRQLVERLGGTSEALDDVATALVRNAELPAADSDRLLAEAQAILERLASTHSGVARYRDNLAAVVALRSRDNPSPTPTGST